MRRRVWGWIGLAVVPAAGAAQMPAYEGPAFEMNRLADGVYAFVFDNPLGPAVDGTALVIINEEDVVVVDAQNTPAATRAVLAGIRKLTSKPVRYVVNTHWHGDHWQGNQVYEDAFPGVEFIAHVRTRDEIERQAVAMGDTASRQSLPRVLAQFEDAYAKGTRQDGTPMTAPDSVYMRQAIAVVRWLIPAVGEIRPVVPGLTLADSLVLRRGERTIVIQHLGRGNTQGDLVVWLPRERIVATGDLLVNPGPYSFGSYLGEWIVTLGRIRGLGADVIVPGHGALQRDHEYLDLVVSLLQYTLDGARAAVARGLDLQATRGAIDFTAFRQRFTGGDPARVRAFDAYFVQPAVQRAWLEARGELDGR